MIKKIKNKINKSEFAKNSITLVSGTTIAQLLPVAVSPILTRLYTPDDFGVLALFTSIVMIFAIIGNGRYEMAIVLPKKDSHAINIWALTVYVSLFTAVILLIAILLFHDFFVRVLNNPHIAGWLYLAPLVVFLISVYNSYNYLFTRDKRYKFISVVKIVRAGIMALLQLGLYFVVSGVAGLLTGFTFEQVAGVAGYTIGQKKNKELLKKINRPMIIAMAKRYKGFPQFTMVGSLFNRLTTELPTLFISSVFNAATLGFYSLGNRILSIPSSFIGTAIGQVFMKQATEEKQKTDVAVKTFNSVVKKLTVIGLPFFILLFFTAEWIFAFVFGEEWRIAGHYAKIITPLLFIRFIVSPVSVVLSVFEEQFVSLMIQLGLLISVIISFAVVWFLDFNFTSFLYTFVILQIIYYLFFLFVLFKASQNKLTNSKKNEK